MEPPAPPFLPPAPPLDDWQVALCVVAVGAAVLCLGCALQVKSSTSRVSSYDPRRDPTLVRTIECMLGCLSRHATSPDVVMQAVDALHASRHLLVPVGAAGSRRRPALGDLAGSPPGAAGRPMRPRGRRAASERPRREGLPLSLSRSGVCLQWRALPCWLLTPHASTKQQLGLPPFPMHSPTSPSSLCIFMYLATSPRRGCLAERATGCSSRAGSRRRAAARCSSCSTW